ncbi:MAG: transglutaminase-like cysteine peptidase [Proteobacteria bacterium]|nr:transglutaminase-like cysteine peptidase [Pseudomonadota bacterium]
MFSLREIVRRARNQPEPSVFTPEQIAELELQVHSGALSERRIIAVLERAAREQSIEFVQSLISRIHTSGQRGSEFLYFAIDYSLAVRDLAVASQYASSLKATSTSPAPPAIFRLALVQYLLESYGTAIALFHEYLETDPGSRLAREYLAECHLRQGSLTLAHEAFRQSGSLSPHRSEFLTQPRSSSQVNWLGRRVSATVMDRPNTRQWRMRVLKAPLEVETQSLAEVDRWLNSCQYISDERLFGEADYWQTPAATEARRAGDCEDFALWAWVQLLRQGYRCRFVLGGLYSRDQINHAWVQIYLRDQVRVLECTPIGYNIPIMAMHATEYRPIMSLDRSLRWYDH